MTLDRTDKNAVGKTIIEYITNANKYRRLYAIMLGKVIILAGHKKEDTRCEDVKDREMCDFVRRFAPRFIQLSREDIHSFCSAVDFLYIEYTKPIEESQLVAYVAVRRNPI